MKHGVAVRTHGPKVGHRVQRMGLADFRERPNVMDVDELGAKLPIDRREVEFALWGVSAP